MHTALKFALVTALAAAGVAGWWSARAPSQESARPVSDVDIALVAPASTTTPDPRIIDPALARMLDHTAENRLPADFSARVPRLRNADEVAAVRAALDDRTDGDAFRNEYIDLLRRSDVDGLDEQLWSLIERSDERERFRAFVAQHLGLSLRRAAGDARSALRLRIASLLGDRHLAVRREALGALVAIEDYAAAAIVRTKLHDPSWRDARDLLVHSAVELGFADMRDEIRPLIHDIEVDVRIAAIHALGVWRDEPSRESIGECALSNIPRLRRAAEFALRNLDDPTSGSPGGAAAAD